MGLGSLVVISDDAATSVRGHGYTGRLVRRVTGSSFATIEGPDGGSHSENSYFAEGKYKAKGTNSSYAGVTDIWIGGGKPGGGGGATAAANRAAAADTAPCRAVVSGGGGYGNVKTHTRVYFSGGSSSAWAF